ncbi:unnamed protein product (macronuclear) [Paramecium tetraurelia]|uniref:Uncharacterized protein n=1 Tax=Paramecium tetraurelia TaxID=5888 RepID=A0EHG1_PARTE|nr:uncharacterized protein GSPATT00027076001 [Paramecium tetraurelia]CAK94752.1 unnamed protein product [Paramecium tetraurelia]|eukprot:XP_001462125.1 hypothetical protein (macronuclear) [Paramecium tetraurelia strain d4-2]
MNIAFSQQNDLTPKQGGTNKKIRKIRSAVKNKKLAKHQSSTLTPKDEAKYMFELTCTKAVHKKQQTNQFRPTLLSYLDSDVFSNLFKIISMQQQKHEIIVKCLPFQEINIIDIKKDFPFCLFLDQVSSKVTDFDTERNLECIKQNDVPQEIFEFNLNPNQDVIGCNRIVNNTWLRMFGMNQDMMIHYLLRNQSFPFGWSLENQFIQNQISNSFYNQQLRVQLVCYNGSKFNARIQVRTESETNYKKQQIQRYTILYFINREQLSLSKVEQNFRMYFDLKDLSQELQDKFIEKTNKQCQFKKL